MALLAWLKDCFTGGLRQPADNNGHERNGHANPAAAIKPAGTDSLENDSHTERAAVWAGHAHLSRDEQMREWEARMDRWFAEDERCGAGLPQKNPSPKRTTG